MVRLLGFFIVGTPIVKALLRGSEGSEVEEYNHWGMIAGSAEPTSRVRVVTRGECHSAL